MVGTFLRLFLPKRTLVVHGCLSGWTCIETPIPGSEYFSSIKQAFFVCSNKRRPMPMFIGPYFFAAARRLAKVMEFVSNTVLYNFTFLNGNALILSLLLSIHL